MTLRVPSSAPSWPAQPARSAAYDVKRVPSTEGALLACSALSTSQQLMTLSVSPSALLACSALSISSLSARCLCLPGRPPALAQPSLSALSTSQQRTVLYSMSRVQQCSASTIDQQLMTLSVPPSALLACSALSISSLSARCLCLPAPSWPALAQPSLSALSTSQQRTALHCTVLSVVQQCSASTIAIVQKSPPSARPVVTNAVEHHPCCHTGPACIFPKITRNSY